MRVTGGTVDKWLKREGDIGEDRDAALVEGRHQTR